MRRGPSYLTATEDRESGLVIPLRHDDLRDGPLEKLWGEGNFRAAGIFFRYQIPCMNFF